jgi:hypothetical protein
MMPETIALTSAASLLATILWRLRVRHHRSRTEKRLRQMHERLINWNY